MLYEHLWPEILGRAARSVIVQQHAIAAVGLEDSRLARVLMEDENTSPELWARMRAECRGTTRLAAWSRGPATADELLAGVRDEDILGSREIFARADFPFDRLHEVVEDVDPSTVIGVLRRDPRGSEQLVWDAALRLAESTDVAGIPALSDVAHDARFTERVLASTRMPYYTRVEALWEYLRAGTLPGHLIAVTVDMLGEALAGVRREESVKFVNLLRSRPYSVWLSAPTAVLAAASELYSCVASREESLVAAGEALKGELAARGTPAAERLPVSECDSRARMALWDQLPAEERTVQAVALVAESFTWSTAEHLVERFLGAARPHLFEAVELIRATRVGLFDDPEKQLPLWLAGNPEAWAEALVAKHPRVAAASVAGLALLDVDFRVEVVGALAARLHAHPGELSIAWQKAVVPELGPHQGAVLACVSDQVVHSLHSSGELKQEAYEEWATLLAESRATARDKDVFDRTMAKMTGQDLPLGQVLAAAVALSS